jgi:hypothetical protein
VEWDHTLSGTGGDASKEIILYGIIGSSSFCQLHAAALDILATTGHSYTVRHLFPDLTDAR